MTEGRDQVVEQVAAALAPIRRERAMAAGARWADDASPRELCRDAAFDDLVADMHQVGLLALGGTNREQLAAEVVAKADVWRGAGETSDGYRRAVAALIDAVDAWRRAPMGVYVPSPTPAAAYHWERYKRTCDPDRQLDGLGDLCMFLGGEWADPGKGSFIGELLKLIAKAAPDRLAGLAAGFPREVRAWTVWMPMSPTPTAAELYEVLTRADANRRVLLDIAKWPAARAMNNADIPGPESQR